ncbi:LmeA family phospholipid-binding protein [Actinomadura parmotrematis]|uniref:DUF2993 domain-containing protein n=1 Tax=Actinomadura parmotrematis TaxID=2864039 RepID=A0ABS7FYN3_9ACTN|nr:DUF2993 domain-containing protein [Actinomadura parmotrematis]MBW8485245.1 DUF2993 domain-containing protein [Actinomadura parmotrematis]
MRKVLLVLLILVAVGLVVADRVGVRVAQDEIGKQIAAEYRLAQRPDVTIHGVPFLTQAVSGNYDRIDVKIGNWTEQGVTVGDVRIDMRGVNAPVKEVTKGEQGRITAETATASAVIPYDVIRKNAPEQVTSIAKQGDDLKVGLAGTLLGLRLTGDAVVKVTPSAKGITIKPVTVSSAGLQLPVAQVAQLQWTVPVTNLPVGSRITRIEPTDAGLRVAATAENVDLNELPAN